MAIAPAPGRRAQASLPLVWSLCIGIGNSSFSEKAEIPVLLLLLLAAAAYFSISMSISYNPLNAMPL
jgi:hypothetical protein